MTSFGDRAVSALGLLCMLAIAYAFSRDRSRIVWRTVAWGLALQLTLGVILLKTPIGSAFFAAMKVVVSALGRYTQAGTSFVFGGLVPENFSIVVNVLPIIIFMGSLFAVLYHWGWIQIVVDALARGLSRTMGTSGAERLAVVANLFVGMTARALVVRPYLARMTQSELFLLMTIGMATVAGSVLIAYVVMLGGSDYAGHLATASLLSLPAGILVSKMIVPEAGTPVTAGSGRAHVEVTSVNTIDAAAQGALAGLRLAAAVGALLIAFVALVALVNDLLATFGGFVGAPGLSLEAVLGFFLAPIAWLMGVPWADATTVGSLLGVKTVLNEFFAYLQLSELVESGALMPRSAIIASYALCGFANFGSLAILLGGIGGMVPEKRSDVARYGMLSILSGSLATFMTACVAGILL